MKNIPKHIILDYSKQPNMMVCKNCGEKRELHLPAPIDDAVGQMRIFVKSHKGCEKQSPNLAHNQQ